jgi:hypothetical protein
MEAADGERAMSAALELVTTAAPRGGERMVDADDRLLAHLALLEREWHDAEVFGNDWRYAHRCHPQYLRIGSAPRVAIGASTCEAFAIQVLQPGTVMLTCHVALSRAGVATASVGWRTSIWQWFGGRWCVRFRQDTPVGQGALAVAPDSHTPSQAGGSLS